MMLGQAQLRFDSNNSTQRAMSFIIAHGNMRHVPAGERRCIQSSGHTFVEDANLLNLLAHERAHSTIVDHFLLTKGPRMARTSCIRIICSLAKMAAAPNFIAFGAASFDCMLPSFVSLYDLGIGNTLRQDPANSFDARNRRQSLHRQ